MEDEIAVKSFDDVVTNLKEATSDVNSRVRNNYLTMIKYYLKVGEGRISKYAGVVISDELVNIFIKRYLELGGKHQDIYS